MAYGRTYPIRDSIIAIPFDMPKGVKSPYPTENKSSNTKVE